MRDMQASAWRKLDARTNGDTFNGKLFKAACADASSLLLSSDEIDSLITTAVRAKWREVEPAIFGTLQEGAGPNQAPRLGCPKLVTLLSRTPGAPRGLSSCFAQRRPTSKL